MVQSDLVLDSAVRDWVLLPLTLSVALMMVLRQYMSKYLSGTTPETNVELKDVREKQMLTRSGYLRAYGGYIPAAAFRERRHFFAAKETGAFCQKSESRSTQEQMMTNPDMMTNMVKQGIGGFLPQIVMGMFVNYFFAGFILGKIPFRLSPSFRPMLQRGIDLPSLDVTYFTSLSYYILLLFGLQGVFRIIFREDTIDDSQMMRQQMAAMGGGAAPGADVQKLFDSERQALELIAHKSVLDRAEEAAAELLRNKLLDAD